MKKICFIFTLILIVFAIIPCSAEGMEVSSMVYASGSELESVYETLQKDSFDYAKSLEYYELTVVKESITPVYTIDMLEYSKTNELNIVPVYSGKTGRGKVYSAKMVDKNGEYAGCIRFYIEKGIAYHLLSPAQPIKDYSKQVASTSYADHAKRIQKVLKAEKLISPIDVKYVIIDWVGEFFYISDQGQDTFISIGTMPTDSPDKDTINQVDRMIDCVELKQIANVQLITYEERLFEKKKWEEEHPGEEWTATDGGYSGLTVTSRCSEIDNILDIANYLNIDFTVERNSNLVSTIPQNSSTDHPADTQTGLNHHSKVLIYGSIALVCCMIVIAGFGLVRRTVINRHTR